MRRYGCEARRGTQDERRGPIMSQTTCDATNDGQRTTRAEATTLLQQAKDPTMSSTDYFSQRWDLVPRILTDYIALLDENARLRHLLAHVDRQQLIAILGSETAADRYLGWEQQPNPEPPRPRRAAALDTEQE